MNYLKYLQYWREPEYANYIIYPHCLAFLELLLDERFRQQLGNAQYVENILMRQQFNHWRYYELNRMNEAFLQLEKEAAEQAGMLDSDADGDQAVKAEGGGEPAGSAAESASAMQADDN